MGSPDARAYSRNKRGIAGSLIWINFDRHSLLNLIQKCAGTFVADIDEIRPQYTSVANGGGVFQSSVVRSSGIPASATVDALDTALTSAGQNAQLATPWYSDQILPFDVTLSGANEYGAMCAAKIFGLEILNEGLQTRCHRPAAHKNSRARAGKPRLRSGSGSALGLSSGLLPARSFSRRRANSSGHSVLPHANTLAHARAGKAAGCPVGSAQRCAPCRMSFRRSRAGQDASAKSGSADP
jgi:hypothetical protein